MINFIYLFIIIIIIIVDKDAKVKGLAAPSTLAMNQTLEAHHGITHVLLIIIIIIILGIIVCYIN